MIDPTDFVTQALPDVEPRWLALLKEAVAERDSHVKVNGFFCKEKTGGITKAAECMGVSRPYVARVLATGKGRIEHPSPKFIERVLAAFGQGRVDCPHLARDIAQGQCQAYAALEWKVIHGSGPEKVLHWRACQHCRKNPSKTGSKPSSQEEKPEVNAAAQEAPCQ